MRTTLLRQVDRGQLAAQGATLVFQALDAAIQARGHAVLAIPGGRSVAELFLEFLEKPFDHWGAVHVFFIDERLVPHLHADSNYRAAREAFLESLVLAGRLRHMHVHPFDATAPLAAALAHYEDVLQRLGGRFNAAVLGVGEDGHVGALYPHHHSIADPAPYFLAMTDSPKPPPARMTSSRALLSRSRFGVALFLGDAKRAALEAFQNPALSVEDCPAKVLEAMEAAVALTDL